MKITKAMRLHVKVQVLSWVKKLNQSAQGRYGVLKLVSGGKS